ncbi:hypothetical protein BBTM_02063 [Bifidobacterium bifidum]|nr:hypothetical protein BBTM_02063 [Bifidobacterium bifidum]
MVFWNLGYPSYYDGRYDSTEKGPESRIATRGHDHQASPHRSDRHKPVEI